MTITTSDPREELPIDLRYWKDDWLVQALEDQAHDPEFCRVVQLEIDRRVRAEGRQPAEIEGRLVLHRIAFDLIEKPSCEDASMEYGAGWGRGDRYGIRGSDLNVAYAGSLPKGTRTYRSGNIDGRREFWIDADRVVAVNLYATSARGVTEALAIRSNRSSGRKVRGEMSVFNVTYAPGQTCEVGINLTPGRNQDLRYRIRCHNLRLVAPEAPAHKRPARPVRPCSCREARA